MRHCAVQSLRSAIHRRIARLLLGCAALRLLGRARHVAMLLDIAGGRRAVLSQILLRLVKLSAMALLRMPGERLLGHALLRLPVVLHARHGRAGTRRTISKIS